MNDTDIQQLIDINFRLLILLGIAWSMTVDYKKLEAYHDDADKCDWFVKAIQAVVYENKPLPEITW